MRRAFGRCNGLSFRIAPTVLAGAVLILGFGPAPLSAEDSPGVDVIVGSAAPELERFAGAGAFRLPGEALRNPSSSPPGGLHRRRRRVSHRQS